MPYFIYKISQGPTNLVKSLEKLEEHSSFKQARLSARNMRSGLPEGSTDAIKVMFAESELHAEEQLMVKREQPILREWEK